MTAPAIDRRIFVVGVPRSGTTLVQSLLAAHSELTSFTESHFFSRHFSLVPIASMTLLTRSPLKRVSAFLAENDADDLSEELQERVRRVLPAAPLRPFGTGAVAHSLIGVLDELSQHRENRNWLEKTPRHLRYLPFLERLLGPSAHFVHVVRDGLETVASLHTASRDWERAYGVDECVERWNADVAFSLRRVGRPNDHFVAYEELTSRPEATLERLLGELGLTWEPEILERYGSTASELTTSEEPWKEATDRALRPSGTSETALSREQRDRAVGALRGELYQRLLESVAP